MAKAEGKRAKAKGQGAGSSRAGLGRRIACGLLGFELLLAGCNSLNHNPTGPSADPLLGGGGAKPAGSAPAGAVQPRPPQAALPLPPASSPSTAALAAGMTRPFDQDHDLRIGSPTPNVSDGWTRPDALPTSNGGGAVLRAPVALTGAVSPTNPQSVPVQGSEPPPTAPLLAPAAPAGPALTLDQAYAQLKARGVLWQRMDMISAGEWRFSCSLPNPRKPGSRRTYEARDRDGASAVKAVLEQMDRDQ